MTTQKPVQQYTVFETTFHSEATYQNPFWDVTVQANVTAPSGKTQPVEAFWDGESDWRLRFSPDELGEWTWQSTASNKNDTGLHNQSGRLHCVPYDGYNPLYIHGPLQVAESQTHLIHADGTPFFWLADTAWNGALRSKWPDWVHYLHGRRQQSFSAIQFVTTQWRASLGDGNGEQAFSGTEKITVNAPFFQRLDKRVEAIVDSHLVAVPVMLWALWESDPGQILADADAIRLARYMMARWGAYPVVWFLGGDGRFLRPNIGRWRRIGRAVFGDRHDRLVTLHPSGQSWVGEAYRKESWFDFIGYQSGHGDAKEHLSWLVKGPPAKKWQNERLKPVINLEPNYEIHPAYHSKSNFSAYEVRRAAYWSLLVSPTAGVTFGHNAIWLWAAEEELPLGHESLGPVPEWYHGTDSPGVRCMTVMAEFMNEISWWTLRPAPDLLTKQPGKRDPGRFVAAAKSDDNSLALIYLPVGGSIEVKSAGLGQQASWVDPRSGDQIEIDVVATPTATFQAPNEQDWLLWLR